MIVIPAYNPDFTLVTLIDKLKYRLKDELNLVVVNDGSNTIESESVFKIIHEYNDTSIKVINIRENKGKGNAIKEGITHASLTKEPFVLIVDADGQHDIDDILNLHEKAQINKDVPIIGTRDFSGKIPFRSKIGNLITRSIFNIIHRSDIRDTQTGLRVYPNLFFDELISIKFDRYEFEQEALVLLMKNNNLLQVDIKTIYEPGNPSSHFRKFRDSGRIYFVLLRSLMLSSFISLLDILLFSFLVMTTNENQLSLFLTRFILVLVYFFGLKYTVFRNKGGSVSRQFTYTVALVTVNTLLISAVFGFAFDDEPINTVAYMFINALLFAFNFVIHSIIFKRK